jgi:hypothetical protein
MYNDLKSKNIESSVGTVHNRMTDFLEKANREEAKRIEDHENQELSGNKRANLIFEEKDGIYLKIKGLKKNVK